MSADAATRAAISSAVASIDDFDEVEPAALRALTEKGENALAELVAMMKRARSGNADFVAVLSRWQGAGVSEDLARLLEDDNFDVVSSALAALGRKSDRAALEALTVYLRDRGHGYVRRSLAASALGVSREPAMRDQLTKAIEQATADIGEDDGAERLIIASAIALSQLGSHEAAPNVLELANSDDEVVRSRAVAALSHVVGKGTFEKLVAALRDDFDEVQVAAIEGLFYFGTKAAVDALILCVDDDQEQFRTRVRTRLQDITGDEFEDPGLTLDDCVPWWEETKPQYRTNTWYRLGKMGTPHEIVRDLKGKTRVSDIRREMMIVTGWTPLYAPDAPALKSQFNRWLKKQDTEYKPGLLYKHGYPQDLAALG